LPFFRLIAIFYSEAHRSPDTNPIDPLSWIEADFARGATIITNEEYVTERLLNTINSPEDLRKLTIKQLHVVAEEIRDLMIDVVSRNGGHLAPSLGAVELTLALHFAYNTPEDKLVWDVGHQAYAHKIITGRRDQFKTLRQHNGISGFPRVGESIYDTTSAGHASTSISTALGLAVARDLLGEKHSVVAIIGDGSLGGGLALEGLNNVGSSSSGMTIVLNDNEMSISRNVGAISRYLTRVLTDKRYTRIKNEIWDRLGKSMVGKSIRSIVSSIDDAVKHVLIPGKFFEDMGIRYLGPVDGHDISAMVDVFRSIKEQPNSPQLVHVITKKGKGYKFAEKDATKYHGIGSFSRDTGDVITKHDGSIQSTFSDVFGNTIAELAARHEKIIGITAAMRDGTKLTRFSKEFPGRFFDVGIAESHAVTFAAGLAHRGFLPVVAMYSTFLQRTFDQLFHDVALDKLHVIFCIDRAGLVGDDGPTHHGMFDLSYLRSIPNATILAPSCGDDLRRMLIAAVETCTGPVFIRYPRGAAPDAPASTGDTTDIGIPRINAKGKDIAFVSAGDFSLLAAETAALLEKDDIHPTMVDALWVKPLDAGFYRKLFTNHQLVVTFENNTISGGFGAGVMELMHSLDLKKRPEILSIGLPDRFIPHGERSKLLESMGLDPAAIAAQVRERCAVSGSGSKRHSILPLHRAAT
jgi:1-deoxy-D-xylulose-5-phosphate synthase